MGKVFDSTVRSFDRLSARGEFQTHRVFLGLSVLLFGLLFWRISEAAAPMVDAALQGVQRHASFSKLDRVWIEGSMLALQCLWFAWLWRGRAFDSIPRALQLAAPCLILAAVSIPGSADVYLYLHYGHGIGDGVNVWLTDSGAFSSPLSALVYWNQPATYPPAAMALFRLAALPLEAHPAYGLACWKLLCLGAHMGTGCALGMAWRARHGSERAGTVTLLYLLQPLVLVQNVAEAHLDGLVNLTTALLLLALAHGAAAVLFPLALLGVLLKTYPLIWLPGIAVYLYKRRAGSAIAIAAMVLVGVLAGLAQLVPPQDWSVFFNLATREMHARSWTAVVRTLEELTGFDSPMRPLVYLGKLIFVALWCRSLWRLFRAQRELEQHLVEQVVWATLSVFLFGTTWVVGWYAVALVPLAFFVRDRLLLAAALSYVFGLSCFFGLDLSRSSLVSLVIAGVSVIPATGFVGLHIVRDMRSLRASPG